MKSLDTDILLSTADDDCREHGAGMRLVNDALRSPASHELSIRPIDNWRRRLLPAAKTARAAYVGLGLAAASRLRVARSNAMTLCR